MVDDKQDSQQQTGHSRYLRRVLAAARAEQGLSAQQVADRIAAHLGAEKLSGQSVYYYERFERHPPVNVFAAWARALGFRLIVELDAADGDRVSVMLLHPETIEVARRMDRAPEATRRAILAMARVAIPDEEG